MPTYSPPWWQIPIALPGDGKEYWVCQYKWMSKPSRAVWDESNCEWRCVENASIVPWYVFPWWREISVEVDYSEAPPES
jgi:hypothetical protein